MMVAAHSSHLVAAAADGLRIARVAGPDDKGNGRSDAVPGVGVDVSAKILAT
jgi:hypothetical protein